MAAKYKLFFQVIQGTLSAKNLVAELRSRKLKVAKASLYSDGTTGVISFQREQDRQTILGTKYLDIKGAKILVSKDDPRNTQTAEGANNRNPNSPPAGSEHLDEGESHSSEFLNPYHFVDVRGYTPRYGIVPHDRYSHHCGRIEAELELVTPGFIPDPEETYYIISDDTVKDENADRQTSGNIHETISNWITNFGINLDENNNILFDPDVRNWDPQNAENHLKKADGESKEDTRDFLSGEIIKEGGKFCIKTESPLRWAHKEMHFFKLNGKHTLPSTSLRGMLRNIIETLSNSCFTGFDEDQGEEYLFHRLDVSYDDQRKEAASLRPVVIKWKPNVGWCCVVVDQAKVLSPHFFNRIGVSGENALAAYLNRCGKYWEKLAPEGRSTGNRQTGLTHYHHIKLKRGKIITLGQSAPLKDIEIDPSSPYKISKILNHEIDHSQNTYNKTFPYVPFVSTKNRLWAIIRDRVKETYRYRGGRRELVKHHLYSIKRLSTAPDDLKTALDEYNDPKKNPDSAKDDVCYSISEIKIKTSFDIDTKTQHRAFFIFDEEDFDRGVREKLERMTKKEVFVLAPEVINQFKSLLRQRKANAEKISNDKNRLNREIAKAMPDDIHDGMLAYYHPNENYLTYTMVPQKPYKNSLYSLLKNLDKLPCKNIDWLCPACQMFGTVVPKEKGAPRTAKKPSGYRGKVVVSNGELMSKAQVIGPVTLKPLSSPKPTFYPFYIIDNRKRANTGRGGSRDYDSDGIRIGRKVYLHHHPDNLAYDTTEKTNLNATIHPLPAGTTFRFTIDFENLTTYELGLLLYALDMKFEGREVGHHIGMGKPLGLGSCRIEITDVWLYDMTARYQDFDNEWKVRFEKNSEEIRSLQLFYKLRQFLFNRDNNHEIFSKEDFSQSSLLCRASQIDMDYFSIPYIWEYHFLKSLNFDSDLRIDKPVRYGGDGWDRGFEWYKNAKNNPRQRLFDPSMLKSTLECRGSVERSMLSP